MTFTMGVMGLGVMGASLARNIDGHGFPVVGFDLDPAKARRLQEMSEARIRTAGTPAELMQMLDRPRRVLMMVPAGPAVDAVIAGLRPLLEPGDVVIDAGNSFFRDTDRRADELASQGVHFLGTGVSGGEAGALAGPSIMPGGPREAWDATAPMFRAIAAKAAGDEPCVAYMGPRGAGHYVKMVHNGIEYGDMQLLAEAYDLLHRGAGIPAAELSSIFAEWNRGELESYLVEITARVLAVVDPETGRPLVDVIADEAQQKGTGKWTSQNAFDLGAPTPTINAAVEARLVSSLKAERTAASRVLSGPSSRLTGDTGWLVDAVRAALYASKVTSYAQGFALMRLASVEYGYAIDPGEVARIWRAGCIIRAALLEDIRHAFAKEPLSNLMLDAAFRDRLSAKHEAWRKVLQTAIGLGIPVPAMSASLAYYDAYRTERLPANLTQAQRDFFGAHTFTRVDRVGAVHFEWPAD